MSFGTTNGGTSAQRKVSFSFYKGDKETAPMFKVKEFLKDGEAVENELPNATNIAGTLKGVYYNKSDNDKFSDSVKFTLGDEELDEVYYISFRLNGVVYPLLNSLLSAKVGDLVKVSTYTDKAGYKQLSLTKPGKMVEGITKDGKAFSAEERYLWKHEYSTLPKIEIFKNSKGVFKSSDSTAIDEFFENEINATFGKGAGDAKPVESDGVIKSFGDAIETDIKPEDLPF